MQSSGQDQLPVHPERQRQRDIGIASGVVADSSELKGSRVTPMVKILEAPRTRKQKRTGGTEPPDLLPRTRSGEVKKRLTWEEKLHVLDPFSSPEATEQRLEEFADLFSYRYADGVITRSGQGPRA